ncbi:hypothetical protein [Methylobacterium brachiatum]|uniref:hypothetical protein n=1 Tax=Methylobacterium brachiatum TaxID=269660 RepID=UPI0013CF0A1D|nr:hypothetical protein [Methylobacterium brachiatum]
MRFYISFLIAFTITGCGTYVPPMQEVWEKENPEYRALSAGGNLVHSIKKKVYCDIAQAVTDNALILPKKWGVQVTLDLQVDETGGFSPGSAFSTPLSGVNSAGVGFGASVSAQSTREDKFGSYWELSRLVGQEPCKKVSGSSLLLISELGISQWLNDALITTAIVPSSSLTRDSEFKQDFLSYRVRFLVISSGSINPTYKLVQFSGNSGSDPLLQASRTRTHDLLITFGPIFKTGGLNIAINSHVAQEFGIAVANASRVSTINPTFGGRGF